jgi:hypothetical protein
MKYLVDLWKHNERYGVSKYLPRLSNNNSGSEFENRQISTFTFQIDFWQAPTNINRTVHFMVAQGNSSVKLLSDMQAAGLNVTTLLDNVQEWVSLFVPTWFEPKPTIKLPFVIKIK